MATVRNVPEKRYVGMTPASPQRRNFLVAAGGVAVMFTLGGMNASGKQRALLRPPGGQEREVFLARCLKCDRCRSICPTEVIAVGRPEDGLVNVRTPVMNFHLGYCTFCKKCIDVCPTLSLVPFDTETVKIGLATLTEFCIAWHTGGCTLCHQACPYDAILLDPRKRPIVDAGRCNGCGRCENICTALVMHSYPGGTLRGIEVRPLSGGRM